MILSKFSGILALELIFFLSYNLIWNFAFANDTFFTLSEDCHLLACKSFWGLLMFINLKIQ